MATKIQLLNQMQYTNLLQINWNEQKIISNFKLIVQALSTQQNQHILVKDNLNNIKEEIANLRKKIDSNEKSRDYHENSNQSRQLNRSSTKIQKKESVHQSMKNITSFNEQNQMLQAMKNQLNILKELMNHQIEQFSDRKTDPTININKQEQNILQGKQNNLLLSLKNQMSQMKPKLLKLSQEVQSLKNDNVKILAKLNANQINLQNHNRNSKITQRRDSIKPKNSTKTLVEQKENISINQIEQKKNIDKLEQQLNNLYLDTNTLRLCYQQIKIHFSDLKRSDHKKQNSINDLHQKVQKLNENLKEQNERHQKQIKSLRNSLLSIQTPKSDKRQIQTPNQNTQKKTYSFDQQNYIDNINDKISKFQNLIEFTVSQSQFDRFQDFIKSQLKQLEKKINPIYPEINLLKESTNQLKEICTQNSQKLLKQQADITALRNLLNDRCGALDRKNNILNSKIEQNKKDIQYVKEDLQYYKSNFLKPSVNSNIKNEEEEKNTKVSNQINLKKIEDLKKQFNNKLHDLRTELINSIRDFERKISNKNNFQQDITILFDKIGQLKLFLNKKAEIQDTKRSLNYLQKKISLALSSLGKQDQIVQDARIAKKNWFCLSCDKLLDSYSGKMSKHIPWDGLNHNKSLMKTSPKLEKSKQSFPALNMTLKKV